MNYIVFDLECTCWQYDNDRQSEIIEIGALRFNIYGEETGSYNRFVKPVIHPRLSNFCTNLTSIEQRFVDRAKTFEEVIEEFQDWIGYFDDEHYVLCSWGHQDKMMFKRDCDLHDIDKDWALKHIDIKQQYQELKSWRRQIGLKKALDLEGFDFEGTQHRAISDAENTSKIFLKYIDHWKF